jgi:hypothetical protein
MKTRIAALAVLLLLGNASEAYSQSAAARSIQWRALAVAGDDSAQVFDNAVAAIAVILATRGVGPINRFTSDPMAARAALPLATAQSMSAALSAVPARAGEGCLVFITSHGGRNGVLMRADVERKFVLAPAVLDRILDQGCGTGPTVAIVSACFSGIFVDPVMEAPNRIILTAARNDRPSFGCGHEEQFTYFDGCMLRAWPGSRNWQSLFKTTSVCVRHKEDALGFQHSEPQAYFGSEVKDLALP